MLPSLPCSQFKFRFQFRFRFRFRFRIPDSGFSIRPFCIDFFNADIPVFISLQIIIVVFGGGGGGLWFMVCKGNIVVFLSFDT